jgi:hypothetical protein
VTTAVDYHHCLDELRRQDRVPASYLTVYASGSIVRGRGNPSSDLDIFVITTDPWSSETAHEEPVTLRPDRVLVEGMYAGDVRWDVEYWLEAQVEELLAKVAPDQLAGGQPAGRYMTEKEIDFLRMLSHSTPVAGDDWWQATRQRLAESSARSVMALRALHTLDVYTEDAVGQLAAGDVESAVLSAKLAWRFAVDALLCSHGEFGESPKWYARTLRELQAPELGHDEFWAVETMASLDAAAPERWVEEVLGLCQRISTEVRL